MSGRSLARLGDRSKQLCRPCTLTRSSVFTDVSEKKIKVLLSAAATSLCTC